MEYKFEKNKIDLHVLREFCEREGEAVEYRKGDQLEREGDPARWFAFVTDGCFKYVNHSSDDKEHITWFSFEGEFVADYPTFLYGRPSQTTILCFVISTAVSRYTAYRMGYELLMLNGMLTYCGLYGTSYENDNENEKRKRKRKRKQKTKTITITLRKKLK